jgi:ATP-binding protein involved in chromosome partitioning
VLDADIGGFSIPRMLGVEGRVQGEKDESGRARFAPLEKPIGPGRLKVVSMGSIEGAGEDQAIMWRGFMLNRPCSTSSKTCAGATCTVGGVACR